MNLTPKEVDILHEKANEFTEILSELGADSVCIFTTHMASCGTSGNCARAGNYYAQRGVVSDWVQNGKNDDLACSLNAAEEEE